MLVNQKIKDTILTQPLPLSINLSSDEVFDMDNMQYLIKLASPGQVKFVYHNLTNQENLLHQFALKVFPEEIENIEHEFIVTDDAKFDDKCLKQNYADHIQVLSVDHKNLSSKSVSSFVQKLK